MTDDVIEHGRDDARSFHECTARLLRLLQGGERGPADEDDLRTVVDGLTRFLAGRFPSLSSADVADITSESLARLLEASKKDRIDPGRSAAPYLTRIAHNLAVSRLRQPTSVELPEGVEPTLADDDLARLLDAHATHERLQAALGKAARAGDHMLLRVVKAWLTLAEGNGVPPSSREVAGRLRISHTTVNEALARLRDYLPA
ncbi:MAG TPA: sigma-70 family RNA polymerase sigma factor [Solirubrobacterales bacterium]|nr:sigma-70 family RNA polymerase sigma factor [Solirubrobacterales bacterium]